MAEMTGLLTPSRRRLINSAVDKDEASLSDTIERVREFDLVTRGKYPLFDLAADFLAGDVALEEGLARYLDRRFRRRQ